MYPIDPEPNRARVRSETDHNVQRKKTHPATDVKKRKKDGQPQFQEVSHSDEDVLEAYVDPDPDPHTPINSASKAEEPVKKKRNWHVGFLVGAGIAVVSVIAESALGFILGAVIAVVTTVQESRRSKDHH